MKLIYGLLMTISLMGAATTTTASAQESCRASRRQQQHQQQTQAVRYTRASAHLAPDIVETAINAGSFTTLVAAVQAAGLVETLKGPGPYTVFAPTDEAFAKIPKETLRSLLKPENRETLAKILTYHVVPGRLRAEDVTALNGARTVEGGRVHFNASGHGVRVNNARVVKTDIETANGIIHVIDTVLMPR